VNDDEIFETLGRQLEAQQPSDAVKDQVAASARAAADRAEGRRRWRTRLIVGVAIGLALAGATAAALTTRPWEGGSIPASPGARAGIAESAVLARAPWLVQRTGAQYVQDTRALPSLQFPAGTGYADATRALMDSVLADGTLPEGASLRSPLERGLVWDPERRRLSMVAPFSYAPGGRILTPSFRVSPALSPSQVSRITAAARGGAPVGRGLAEAITLAIPRLRPCQIQGSPGSPCPLPTRRG